MPSDHGFYELASFHNSIAALLFVIFATLALIFARLASINMQRVSWWNKVLAVLIGLLAMVCWLTAQSIFFNNLNILTVCQYIQ